MRGYEACAAGYDELYSDEQDEKYRCLRDYWSQLCSPVLDCGCGTGRLLQSPWMQGKASVGVDCSLSMLMRARQRLREVEGIALVQADVEYLPFRDRTFNGVISFSVVEDLPEWARVIGEMSRVARKGSCIIMSSVRKAFRRKAFSELLAKSDVRLMRFIEERHVKDNVAICMNG